jgi:SOS-response transcriptional repressor LexA
MGNLTTTAPLWARGHLTIRSLTSKESGRRRVSPRQGLVPPTVSIPVISPGLTDQTLSVPKYLASGRLLVALRVETQSMAPDLETGDLVAVSLAEKAPIPGDLVTVVTAQGQLLFRRFMQHGFRAVIADARGHEHPVASVRLLGLVLHVVKGASDQIQEGRP